MQRAFTLALVLAVSACTAPPPALPTVPPTSTPLIVPRTVTPGPTTPPAPTAAPDPCCELPTSTPPLSARQAQSQSASYALDAAEQKWQNAGISNYHISFVLIANATMSLHGVTVINGKALPTAVCPTTSSDGCDRTSNAGEYYTVTAFFDRVRNRAQLGGETLDVTYDPAYGYPRRIAGAAVDSRVVDSGYIWTITVQILP